RGERRIEIAAAAHHLLRALGHAGGDALPLRHLRRRGDALELKEEGRRLRVRGELRELPGRRPAGQVSRELVEPRLLRRFGEVFQPLPRRLRLPGVAEEDEARAARERQSWIGHSRFRRRQRRRGPAVLYRRRQAAAELAEVPGT